jgi:hypothetical protein
VRRPQQMVQCSRRVHRSCVANFRPGLVRYRIRGSFPAVALSARLYPPVPARCLHPRDSKRRNLAHSRALLQDAREGKESKLGFVLRCRRSFAPSYPRRHGTFRSIRATHAKPTSRAHQKGQVLTMFFYCLALDSRSIVIQQNRPPHAIHFATPPYRLSPKDSNQIGCW